MRTHTGVLPNAITPPVPHSPEQRRVTAMAIALLLRYPDAHFFERLVAVQDQLDELPHDVARQIRRFAQFAANTSLIELQEHYVATFDQRRRCSLNLSYYAVGDTRQRGAAILAFREQLAALGMEEISEELPDHLCVVLESLALADASVEDDAVDMVASHRDGIEVLRSALANIESPYEHLVTALCMMLPEIDQETIDRYVNLIRQGPPAELVGLDTTPLPFPSAVPTNS